MPLQASQVDARRHPQRRLGAGEGLGQVDLDAVADVGAAARPRPPRRRPPPMKSPNIWSKMSPMPPPAKVEAAAGAAAALLEGGVAVAVVGGALLLVLQHVVGFVDLLELRLGLLVARIAVRVELHGEFAVGAS